MTPDPNLPLDEHKAIDRAVRETAAAFTTWTRELLRLAVRAGGQPLLQQAEQALQAGGFPMLRVGLLAAGAEIVLTIEGQPGAVLEIWSASGLPGSPPVATH